MGSSVELTTVTDDAAVLFDGTSVVRLEGLEPDSEHVASGIGFRTLPSPGGQRLATFCVVNDVHFGETRCGGIEGLDVGPVFTSGPGQEPYVELMNRRAVEEMQALGPDAVIVNGDLTALGLLAEYERFREVYEPAFGKRLTVVRGNHDAYAGQTYAADPFQEVVLDGVRIAVVDTTDPGRTPGALLPDQLDWLDQLAAGSDRPVVVVGHHPPVGPAGLEVDGVDFGLAGSGAEELVELVGRRSSIVGYLAGHTHRNHTARFEAAGDVPFGEVSSVKDFPGVYAEIRVHEGGLLRATHRVSAPDALAWTDQTRGMFFGLYPEYSFGSLADRCYLMPVRDA